MQESFLSYHYSSLPSPSFPSATNHRDVPNHTYIPFVKADYLHSLKTELTAPRCLSPAHVDYASFILCWDQKYQMALQIRTAD
jgi:hypothetical protein